MFDTTAYGEYKSCCGTQLKESQPSQEEENNEEEDEDEGLDCAQSKIKLPLWFINGFTSLPFIRLGCRRGEPEKRAESKVRRTELHWSFLSQMQSVNPLTVSWTDTQTSHTWL